MAIPKDKKLYEKVKKSIYQKYPKQRSRKTCGKPDFGSYW